MTRRKASGIGAEGEPRGRAEVGARDSLTSAEGKYEGAEAQVSYSEIRSPIDGVVTDRPLFAGETAAAGAPLITVMDTSTLLAKTAHRAEPGAADEGGRCGDDQCRGIADPVAAKVSLISPALDPGSTTVEVWLQVDNKKGELKVGTPVKSPSRARTVAKAWKIPAAAMLTAQDGSKSVMVVGADGAAHSKPVTLGIADGEDVQMLSGLARSDTGDHGRRLRTG